MSHFDMHEDIAETRRHLADGHHAVPVMRLSATGQGAAEALAAQHERLHKKRWFFTFGMNMHLAFGRVRMPTELEASVGMPGIPLGKYYVTILASDEMAARMRMLQAFGHFASVYDDQRGHEVVQHHDMTPLLAGGDLE